MVVRQSAHHFLFIRSHEESVVIFLQPGHRQEKVKLPLGMWLQAETLSQRNSDSSEMKQSLHCNAVVRRSEDPGERTNSGILPWTIHGLRRLFVTFTFRTAPTTHTCADVEATEKCFLFQRERKIGSVAQRWLNRSVRWRRTK